VKIPYKLSILIGLVFLSVNLSAQINARGKFLNLPFPSAKKISFEYWLEDRWQELDTIHLSADYSFEKKLKSKFGLGRIRIWGQNTKWIEFIMPEKTPTDSVMDFGTIDFSLVDGGFPAPLRGIENEAYGKLLLAYKDWRSIKDSSQKFDSSRVNMIKKRENLELATETFNKKCLEISSQYKGTLTGDVVVNLYYIPLQKDYPQNLEGLKRDKINFERDHAFDRIPLDDKRILLHSAFMRAINLYSSKFSKKDTAERILFIDKLMSKRKGVKEVDDFIFSYLMNKFVNNHDEISLSYLMQYSNSSCSDEKIENMNENSKLLLQAIKNSEPGKKGFDLVLPDSIGQTTRLSDIAVNNKLTILFFWRSGCSHCKEYEPELLKLYDKYKAKGLAVVGISIDKEEKDWKKFLRENKMSWKNLRAKTELESMQLHVHYPIPGTPTMIILDKNLVIKNRLVQAETLDGYLEQQLR